MMGNKPPAQQGTSSDKQSSSKTNHRNVSTCITSLIFNYHYYLDYDVVVFIWQKVRLNKISRTSSTNAYNNYKPCHCFQHQHS